MGKEVRDSHGALRRQRPWRVEAPSAACGFQIRKSHVRERGIPPREGQGLARKGQGLARKGHGLAREKEALPRTRETLARKEQGLARAIHRPNGKGQGVNRVRAARDPEGKKKPHFGRLAHSFCDPPRHHRQARSRELEDPKNEKKGFNATNGELPSAFERLNFTKEWLRRPKKRIDGEK